VTKAKTAVTPHPFRADPETPGDPISGDQVCISCHCLGKPNDARHAMPAAVPDGQSRAAGDN
jgi:hypothetical protein